MSFTRWEVFFVLSVLALTMPFSAGVTNLRDGNNLSPSVCKFSIFGFALSANFGLVNTLDFELCQVRITCFSFRVN